jgi:hypothetical protein
MRYLIAILLGITLIAPACSSEDKQPQSKSTSVEEKTQTPDQAFLGELHREFPDQLGVSDDGLIQVAKAACKTLDQGSSVESLFFEIGAAADSPAETKLFAEAASEGIATYCPEHVQAVRDAAAKQAADSR